MKNKTNLKIIIQFILFAIIILISFFIVYYISQTKEKNKQLEERIKVIEQVNLDLINENNYLLNENERLGMMNSEIWELFLADHYIKEGEPYSE